VLAHSVPIIGKELPQMSRDTSMPKQILYCFPLPN
jgi:hypothetical protein